MKTAAVSSCGLLATLALLLASPALAAIAGTVINRTTGQPQPGAAVALNKVTQNGMEPNGETKSDAQGKFSLDQQVEGPNLLRVTFDGVTYNSVLSPGAPSTNLTVDVYAASLQPGSAKVSKHMLLFQPGNGQMTVNETYLYTNPGKTSWNDPDHGTLHFFLPAAAKGKAEVHATAPGGMPVDATAAKTAQPDLWAVDFAVKPGETRFDVNYTLPYTNGQAYSGKIVTADDNTYLIAPNGITLTGAGLTDLGTEPRTQAHIFGFTGKVYKIQLTGTEAPTPATDSSAAQQDSGPQIEQILPRVNGKAVLILSLALGALALGFALLYRAPVPKESDERGRR